MKVTEESTAIGDLDRAGLGTEQARLRGILDALFAFVGLFSLEGIVVTSTSVSPGISPSNRTAGLTTLACCAR